jgi:hypothetical protein
LDAAISSAGENGIFTETVVAEWCGSLLAKSSFLRSKLHGLSKL